VLADVDVHLVDVEGEQGVSLPFVMNFIYMNPYSGTMKVPELSGDAGAASLDYAMRGPEAFLRHVGFALHMARFPEAERRLLHKMICMNSLGYWKEGQQV
jgi:hypothetical protein